MPTNQGSSVLALDTGRKRVGVAIASLTARLPRPLTTLRTNDRLIANIKALIEAENVTEVVVGLPRNLSGDGTSQTDHARQFGQLLRDELLVPVYFQDEALTTKKALAELRVRKKRRNSSVTPDSLAAVYILEGYLTTGPMEAKP
jgi:putative Holliday junction resolvase